MSLMYSWTPKISSMTSTVGNGPVPSGRAEYAGRSPLSVGIVVSPATMPAASVWIACASTRVVASVNPLINPLITTPRRGRG